MSSSHHIIVVGQTPPPYHGQSIMLERLLAADIKGVNITHVRMAFSATNDNVGKPGLRKLLHLISVIIRIFMSKWQTRAAVLYYPPAGPNKVPIIRDCCILICTRWMFKKTIFHMQASGLSTIYEELNSVGKWFYRRAYNNPDVVIRLSELTIDDATALNARKEYIVPNCAEDIKENFTSSKLYNVDNPVNLLYVGTVCRTKGILVLLEACRLLKFKGQTNFHLDIIGGFQPASFEKEVIRTVETLALQKNVTVHGQKTGNDKHRQFADADIFCFPTFYESEAFPCVVVEAMSFALPVITTTWRGIPSIVDQNRTGILCPPCDPEAISQGIQSLYANLPLRKELGMAGRCKYLKHYTTEKHVKTMEAIFLEICES